MKRPRLPRFRIGRRSPPSAEAGNRLKLWGGGLLVFLLFFALGLYLFFPVDALRQRIESEVAARSPVALAMEEMELTFPPGVRATGVTAAVRDLPLPPLRADRITLSPKWISLVAGDQTVDFSAELDRGRVDGSLSRSGALEAEVASVAFTLPLMPDSAMRAEGLLERGRLKTVLPVGAKDASRLKLALEGVRVTGLDPLGLPDGALSLGRIALAGNGTGPTFDIERLTAEGGDLEATGEGSVYLADPPERSRLNLTLVVRPAPGLDPNVTDLLTLIGRAGSDGSRRLRITGTLARPVVR